MPRLQQPFEFFPLLTLPRHGTAEPRTLQPHPEYPDVFLEHTSDGPDFIRVCVRHQWSSIPTPDHAPACPFCVAEFDEQRGRERYRALQGPHVRIVGVFES